MTLDERPGPHGGPARPLAWQWGCCHFGGMLASIVTRLLG
jgi:hypothetical protein